MIKPTYPGVYVQEQPSGIHTITGVSTSTTAFVGKFLFGQTGTPTKVSSMAEFNRLFGGIDGRYETSFAVMQFFLNGGADAYIVRLAGTGGTAASAAINKSGGNTSFMTLTAASPGLWGNDIRIVIKGDTTTHKFNMIISAWTDGSATTPIMVAQETYRGLTGSNLSTSLAQSKLVTVAPANGLGANDLPQDSPAGSYYKMSTITGATQGVDATVASSDYTAGIQLLDAVDTINILCIPDAGAFSQNDQTSVYTYALNYCQGRRAFVIVDPLSTANSESLIESWQSSLNLPDDHGAVYYPWVSVPDPTHDGNSRSCAPSGTMAGIYARIDSNRGVWKAPAGVEAGLRGVVDVAEHMTDDENGDLNQLGINCIRSFPVYGIVAWGARTLNGSDQAASDWKYIPVRRLAQYIEESLFRGTKWVVFEPNDEPLWAKIRVSVRAFMMSLFRQGAFQGSTPDQAFFVKCDGETTTENDREQGVVRIQVGFAPLRPAEFVMITIQQTSGN